MIDLGPATRQVADLVTHVEDNQLDDQTPCPGTTVGDLVDHIGMVATGFAASAEKRRAAGAGPPPRPSRDNLEPGWRDRITRNLDALAVAWREPAAWDGVTSAGGIELPANVAGVVALDELVVHGWDLAVATGQPYDAPEDEVVTAMEFVNSFEAPRDGSLFGPIVTVAPDAPVLDRLLGLTGRQPEWGAEHS